MSAAAYDERPRPVATLAHIRLMRSKALEIDGDRVIRHSLLGSREVWQRQGGNGEKALYQLKSETREET